MDWTGLDGANRQMWFDDSEQSNFNQLKSTLKYKSHNGLSIRTAATHIQFDWLHSTVYKWQTPYFIYCLLHYSYSVLYFVQYTVLGGFMFLACISAHYKRSFNQHIVIQSCIYNVRWIYLVLLGFIFLLFFSVYFWQLLHSEKYHVRSRLHFCCVRRRFGFSALTFLSFLNIVIAFRFVVSSQNIKPC